MWGDKEKVEQGQEWSDLMTIWTHLRIGKYDSEEEKQRMEKEFEEGMKKFKRKWGYE